MSILKKNKWLLIISAILGAVAVAAIIIINGNAEEVETYQVKPITLKETLVIGGQTKAEDQIDLKFESSGKVIYLPVAEGDQVKAGQLVAQIDTTSLKNALAQAEASLRKFESIRTETYETYKVETQTNVIKEKLRQADENVETYRLAAEAARIALQKAYLYSPISGTITDLSINVGDYVTAGTSVIATIANLENIYFQAEIDEEDIAKINQQQEVTIKLDAYPNQSFAGRLADVKKEISSNSSGDSILEAHILFLENPTLDFIGLSGDALFTLSQTENTLAIPLEALVYYQNQNYVFTLNNSLARRVPIKLGMESDNLIEVTDGANDGDLVILNVPESFQKKPSFKARALKTP